MKNARTITWFYLVGGLLAAVALWQTARTIADTPRNLAQLARRHGDLIQLQGLAERHAVNRAAVAALESTSGTPPELKAWCQQQWPDLPVEVSERETVPLLPGWSVRRVDVRLADVTLAEVGHLLNQAEALRPPWRVVEAQLTAGSSAGRGRASLVMEALVRKENGTKP